MTRAHISPGFRLAKRLVDLAVALVMLPFVVVVVALAAVAVVIDSPGSPFFVQYRTGKDGRLFPMVKLRTMVPDAESLKADLAVENRHTGPDFKIVDDPRITRVGRFLRKTSIDELPQLFNVLAGHMSLVGPRPTSFGADTYSLWQTKRLEVRPGMTGVWQVYGRGMEDFDERVRLELSYLSHMSIARDLGLMVRTVPAMLTRTGE
jgi:lipopolysaccharide/colanic/teichoic acid biosynthesis glycosyltransferase